MNVSARSKAAALAAALPFVFSACTKKNTDPKPVSLASRGQSVYMSNCMACHNSDPKSDGPLGPAISGSSRELIEARVLRAEYPKGYTPKRTSRTMVALPHLKDDIESLHAFLNSL
jgi:mono/diheme cytochrome c family protein